MKSSKHFFWRILIFAINLIPISAMKNLILTKLFQFEIGENTALHFNIKFYKFGNIKIGAGSVLNRNILLDNRYRINIGNGVAISQDCKIFTTGHENDANFSLKYGEVRIDDNVIIYSNVIICPNVHLKAGCIVYPGSVVFSGEYPKGSVLLGNPAEVKYVTDIQHNRRFNYKSLFAL